MNQTKQPAPDIPMQTSPILSKHLTSNIHLLKQLLPIGTSFDLTTRDLYFLDTPAFFLGVNGFIKTEILQQIFSDLQNPVFTKDSTIQDLALFMQSKIGYAQVELVSDMDKILKQVLSGPVLLLVDGFDQGLLIDVRTYPTRSIEEPDTEHITRGSREGFVETMLFNANLIRRHIRSTGLTFELTTVGTDSKTDIAITYVDNLVDPNQLTAIRNTLQNLHVSALTMGAKSLSELLVNKKWYHPLPSIFMTERPDVACSYLLEGYILLIVDTFPCVLVLPSSFFQFTQSPEDYSNSPLVGGYFRIIRFLCIPISLFLLPVFFLLAAYFPEISASLNLLQDPGMGRFRIFFYVLAVEFLLDLFKYSSSHISSRFSGSLSIIGGLIIGDVAVSLNWASTEVLFYAAITLLTSLSLTSLEFSDGLRLFRIFLILMTGLFGLWGFCIGTGLILLSIATTPTFDRVSYLWPLWPFNWQALKTLLFRYPTKKAQPGRTRRH